ncbi:unnamed protein product, partial [Rotaria sp. Silwood1]
QYSNSRGRGRGGNYRYSHERRSGSSNSLNRGGGGGGGSNRGDVISFVSFVGDFVDSVDCCWGACFVLSISAYVRGPLLSLG